MDSSHIIHLLAYCKLVLPQKLAVLNILNEMKLHFLSNTPQLTFNATSWGAFLPFSSIPLLMKSKDEKESL